MNAPIVPFPNLAMQSYDGVCCKSCGCAWFELKRDDGTPPQVYLDKEGHINGYSGELTCADCGVPLREGPGELPTVEPTPLHPE